MHQGEYSKGFFAKNSFRASDLDAENKQRNKDRLNELLEKRRLARAKKSSKSKAPKFQRASTIALTQERMSKMRQEELKREQKNAQLRADEKAKEDVKRSKSQQQTEKVILRYFSTLFNFY